MCATLTYKRYPRFTVHFIPTSSSRLNLIERWFAQLDKKAVRQGAFHSVRELQHRITEFLTAWNAKPTPVVWTASVDRILEKGSSLFPLDESQADGEFRTGFYH